MEIQKKVAGRALSVENAQRPSMWLKNFDSHVAKSLITYVVLIYSPIQEWLHSHWRFNELPFSLEVTLYKLKARA